MDYPVGLSSGTIATKTEAQITLELFFIDSIPVGPYTEYNYDKILLTLQLLFILYVLEEESIRTGKNKW